MLVNITVAPKCHAKIVIFFFILATFLATFLVTFLATFLVTFLATFSAGSSCTLWVRVTVKLKFVHVVEAGKRKSRS